MKRPRGTNPRRPRAFVVVSRQVAIDSRYETVMCAPVYSTNLGLSSQLPIGPDEGLKHQSVVHCDGLVSIQKSRLTDFVGSLDAEKMVMLNEALRVALGLD